MIELDDSVSRSVPLTCHSYRKRDMKRRKRKRIEDTVDITLYMSNHNIFSYYENKRSETDCHSVDNDCDDQADEVVKRNDDYKLYGLNRGDSPLEKILFNLDGLQSRVLSLKTKLGEVMSENIRDISRSATNLLQEDPHIITYARSLSSPPGNNGDAMPRHHLSEYGLEVPKSAVFSYGDAADVDMIECTVDLLLADALLHQHQGRDLYKDIAVADDVLIINQAAKEELQDFEKVRHGEVKLQEAAKEEARSCSEDANTAPTALAAAPGPFGQNGERPVLKFGYTGKKSGRKPKRKRRGGCVSGLKSERIQKR